MYGCKGFGKMLIGEVRVPVSKVDGKGGSFQGWGNLQPKGLMVSISVISFLA